MNTMKLRHVARLINSNVDKIVDPDEASVQLCNYVHVYRNDRIVADMELDPGSASADEIERFGLRRDDVIITKDSEDQADIAVPAYVPNDMPGVVCGYHLAILRPDPRRMRGDFLAWSLRARNLQDAAMLGALGVTRFGLSQGAIKSMDVPCLSLDDQRAIAAFLDAETARVDALIKKKERLANVLDERLGAFLDALTFDDRRFMAHRRRLRWICRATEGQVDPTVAPWSTMPLVAPNHIESRTGRLSAVETAEEQQAISGKYAFQKGAVLYSKIRPALAKACIAPFDGLCSADMYPLIPTKEILPNFLLMQLLSRSFTEWAVLESNRVAMPKLNRETLGSAIMVVPPIEEQRVSVERFQCERGKMDRLMAPIRTSVDRLRELRSALITAAVNGQITPEAWRRRGDTDRRLDRIETEMAAEAAE